MREYIILDGNESSKFVFFSSQHILVDHNKVTAASV